MRRCGRSRPWRCSAATRTRFVPPAIGFLVEEGEPAPYVEAPAPGWNEPSEDTEPDALTVVVPPSEDGSSEDGRDPWEHGAEADEPEPELAERSGIFRRRR